MKQLDKQEFSYEEFLKIFFTSTDSENKPITTPREMGISISQSVLSNIDKSIQDVLHFPEKNKSE